MTRRFTPTDEQRQLIAIDDGNHLLHAPPGAGKTQVLVERIVRILSDDPRATFRVLALTFSTKAADSLRERVRMSADAASARVTACTFHTFCMSALQSYGQMVDFPTSTTVFERFEDRKSVLAQAIIDAGLSPQSDAQIAALLDQISRRKRDLMAPQAVPDPEFMEIYAGYDQALRAMNGCDFDDLLFFGWRLFSENPAVARHYRRMYRYIMVDEAQDTNRAQFELLRALCDGEHQRVMLVADSDQLIHGYAGARDEWLAAFVKDFQATQHQLTTNFRSAQTIVQAANALIQHNPRGVSQPLPSAATDALGAVCAVEYPDETAEAEGVTQRVLALLTQGLDPSSLHPGEDASLAPEDIGILGRSQYCLRELHRSLRAAGVPVLYSPGQQNLVESPLAMLLLQGLRLIYNPADQVTRENIRRAWMPQAPRDAVRQLSIDQLFELLAREAEPTRPLASLFGEHSEHSERRELKGLMPKALELLDEHNASTDEALAMDLVTLGERWTAYREHVSPAHRSLGGLLAELSLAGRTVVEGPGVRVMTIHAAKGLEFRAVALVGLNEGTLPDYRAKTDREIVDERRLCYVAVTRAARALLLTRPATRRLPNQRPRLQVVSRFVDELGLTMTSPQHTLSSKAS